jgi:hypothetical protein
MPGLAPTLEAFFPYMSSMIDLNLFLPSDCPACAPVISFSSFDFFDVRLFRV